MRKFWKFINIFRLSIEILYVEDNHIADHAEVHRLINALQSTDVTEQRAAAWKLYDIGDEQAVDALVLALDNMDWEVQNAAAWGLAKIKGKKAIRLLLAKLEQSDQPTRSQIIKLLAEVADESLTEFFLAKLNDENEFTKSVMIEALGQIGNEQIIPFLIDALQDVSLYVKVAAIKVLEKIGNFSMTSYLTPLLHDTRMGVRLAAATALRNLGWLPETVEDEIAYFMAWGQWSLVAEYRELAVEPLVILLNKDEDCWIAASNTLFKIQTRTTYQHLVKAHEETHYLRKAARATSNDNLTQVVEKLIEKLDHSDLDTRLHAIQSLGWIGDQSAIEPLARHLADPDIKVRLAVIAALQRLDAGAALINAFDDPDIEVSSSATNAIVRVAVRQLGSAGRHHLENETIAALEKLLQSENDRTRLDAEYTLKRIQSFLNHLE